MHSFSFSDSRILKHNDSGLSSRCLNNKKNSGSMFVCVTLNSAVVSRLVRSVVARTLSTADTEMYPKVLNGVCVAMLRGQVFIKP